MGWFQALAGISLALNIDDSSDPQLFNFVLIANPESRRVGQFQSALAQLGLPVAHVITYEDLLLEHCPFNEIATPENWVRFEAPERNFGVFRSLVAAGSEPSVMGTHQRISADDAQTLLDDLGRIYYPRQWFLGWQRRLQQWNKQIQGQCLNPPEDIITMFDKPRCQKVLAANNIPIPPLFDENQMLRNVEQLRDRMDYQSCDRVFVKLAHGSSASGVIAFERRGGIEQAITTVERVVDQGELKFYNSRKIQAYRRPHEIDDILNFVIQEGAQIEAWVPKARLRGREFDVRIVVVGGKAFQGVVRVGRSPMTNLHLGSDRFPLDILSPKISAENWATMMQTCERAAACFPNSLYCGIDLLIAPNFRDHYILEMNAFGDLLQQITWQGQTTYETEIKTLLAQQGIDNKHQMRVIDSP